MKREVQKFVHQFALVFAPRLRLEFAPPDCVWSSPPVNAGVRPQIAPGVRHSVLSAGVRWQFLTFAFATYSSRGYSSLSCAGVAPQLRWDRYTFLTLVFATYS